MPKFVVLTVFIAVYCVGSTAADAQRQLNQDYFTASRNPQLSALLASVDKHHTTKAMQWIRKDTGLHYAAEELKYTLDTFPNHAQALFLIGVVAKMTKNYGLPLPYYEKALRLYPQYAMTHAQYGHYLVEIGELDQGIARLESAIKMDANLAVAHAWLSKAYSTRGNVDLARQEAERARALGYQGDF